MNFIYIDIQAASLDLKERITYDIFELELMIIDNDLRCVVMGYNY